MQYAVRVGRISALLTTIPNSQSYSSGIMPPCTAIQL
jgi:hypothetical protein